MDSLTLQMKMRYLPPLLLVQDIVMKFTVTVYMLQDLPSFFVLITNLAQNPIWKMFFPL